MSPFVSQILQVLGTLLLLTAFATIASRHLAEYIRAFAAQSVFLALVAATVGYSEGSVDLFALAVLTLLVKTGLITYILSNVARRLHVQREVRPYLNLPASLLAGVLLTLLAFLASPAVVAPGSYLSAPPLAVSIALILIGLFIMSTRRQALAQVVGLLTIENGLFSGAITIAHGMPLIVELGILFDVLVAVLVMGLLVQLIHREFVSADTGELRQLKG